MWLGLRPLRDLTKHLKARTDDGHAATDIEANDYLTLSIRNNNHGIS